MAGFTMRKPDKELMKDYAQHALARDPVPSDSFLETTQLHAGGAVAVQTNEAACGCHHFAEVAGTQQRVRAVQAKHSVSLCRSECSFFGLFTSALGGLYTSRNWSTVQWNHLHMIQGVPENKIRDSRPSRSSGVQTRYATWTRGARTHVQSPRHADPEPKTRRCSTAASKVGVTLRPPGAAHSATDSTAQHSGRLQLSRLNLRLQAEGV